MQSTPRRLGVVLVPLVALLASGLGGAAAAPTAQHQRALTPITLVLKWLPQAQFAGYYVALKKGYYAGEGLDVTILPGGPDVVPEQAVSTGRAQFGTGWLPALLAARDQGMPLVNIAQIYQTTGMRLLSFKSEHLSSPRAFSGKRVGVWFGGNQYQFLALMDKLGMAPSKSFTVVHQGFDMTAFLSHNLDVASAMTYNELGLVLDAGVKLSDLNVMDYGANGVGLLEDGIFARADYLAAHRDLAVRLLRASIHGWQDTVQDPAVAAAIVKTYDASNVMSLAHQTYMAREVNKLIEFGPAIERGIGYMDPAAFARTAKISLQYHVIRKAPVGAYDQSYWQEALFGSRVLSYEAESAGNLLRGGAIVAPCSYCSNDRKVRFIGNKGTLGIAVHVPRDATYTLTIAYTNRVQTRYAMMAADGGAPVRLTFAPTGSWTQVGILQVPIHLKAGAHTLVFGNPMDWTPDFDRITISA